MPDTGILLESGTNELELVEFQVNDVRGSGNVAPGYYGINVAKVREILRGIERLSAVPKSHPALAGVLNLRGKIIPVISLPVWLGKSDSTAVCDRIIITEFNHVLTGFMVHHVDRIHRISWDNVEPPSGLMNKSERDCVTGLVQFEDRILMMLDFEKIVGEINPETGTKTVAPKKSEKRRYKTLFVAEDSAFIRKIMVDTLRSAGYRVFSAGNGGDAYQRLTDTAAQAKDRQIPLARYINLVITDVEMPKMDGLHLITKLNTHEALKDVPVVIYSSMMTPENKKKWGSLGVVDFIGKPDLDRLVQVIDAKAL